MNYQRIYENLTAKDMIADYTELHHIIPKCMGGSNDTSNLVKLTPEAHFVAHQLLVKIYPNNYKLLFAAGAMAMNNQGLRPNNRLYGWLRRKLSIKNTGEGNPMYGKTFSAETKENMRINNTGEKNPFYGRKHTEETLAKMRAAKIGKTLAPETIAKIVKSNKKTRLARTKPYMAHNTVRCPHCNKRVSKNVMTRHHFDNCKLKP